MVSGLSAIILEVVGCLATLGGIGVEVIKGADLGFILITGGSLFVALGGLVFAKLMRRVKQ